MRRASECVQRFGVSWVSRSGNTSPIEEKLQYLLTRISELGGQDAYPVVPLDLFFDGNDDPASFAPNLDPHPGISEIYAVLHELEERPDVSAVMVQIDEVLEPPEWPYASSVYVITSADAEEVRRCAAPIQPDEMSTDAADDYGWSERAGRNGATPPPGAPAVPSGYRPVVLYWD
jgi:hypothetical protein